MAAAVDCILKLGGSALTQKNQLETLKAESLRRAAALVSKLWEAGERRCIIVHGAGSFGHFQAREYDVALGTSGGRSAASDNLRQGLCLTRLSVTKVSTEQYATTSLSALQMFSDHMFIPELCCSPCWVPYMRCTEV
ncbi:hypothetical protein L345_00890 [Ophiophagus hannah]|uniref:Aspartate/glutamate/uridylate kinase domain-containing protein n=1 Tax=Ophiophagus hannah TaxID=8665 RepID=V8PGX3_OPHHA|nr:hypothetical protein L345_00890 [Ophiophagus hannah]